MVVREDCAGKDTGGGREDTGGGREDTGGGREDTGGGREDTGGGREDTGENREDTGGGREDRDDAGKADNNVARLMPTKPHPLPSSSTLAGGFCRPVFSSRFKKA